MENSILIEPKVVFSLEKILSFTCENKLSFESFLTASFSKIVMSEFTLISPSRTNFLLTNIFLVFFKFLIIKNQKYSQGRVKGAET